MKNTASEIDQPQKASPDWEKIELDYRAGIKTLRQIADQHGITEGAIRKRAKKESWERNLSEKIAAKAEALVRKEAVRNAVRSESTIPERDIIDANAQAIVDVRLSHRKDVARAKSVAMSLFAELEAQAGVENAELLSNLAEIMNSGDNDRMMAAYQKIITLPERVKSMKALAESLRVCIDMERQAFGLDTMPAGSLPGSTVPTVAVQFIGHTPRADDE